MAITSQDLEDAHNRGQEDGANNRWNPPTKWYQGPITAYTDEMDQLQKAYEAGWEHGKSQR